MSRVFVGGLGFLGMALARRLYASGWEVVGATRSAKSAAALAGEPFRVVAVDVADAAALRGIGEFDAVAHCASSGRGGAAEYRAVYLEGVRALVAAFPGARLLFTSSTSVYAQSDGAWVNEESAAEPQRETGRLLREAEDAALAAGGAVARLAGIYGPGRAVLLKKFLAGEAVIEGAGARIINQIHRDDAAAALALLVERGARGIFNVADDTPLPQRDVFAWLAQHFARPLPPHGPIDPNRKRGWTSKRVANAKLRGLGWAPQWPSFREAIASGRMAG